MLVFLLQNLADKGTDLISVFGPPDEFVIRVLVAVDILIELFNSKIVQLE